jgi:hypothetical protein
LIFNFKNRNYGTTTLLNDSLGFYKTNAKRTDQNGSKTRNLRIKQRCRDLYAINYRLQGLAEKKYKTQKIGLTNTEKIRVRPEKFHGGAGLKRWKRSRGFLQNLQETGKNRRITSFFGDWIAKARVSSMAAARKLPVGQNWSDLDHGRAREVGEKKEEREGVRFHALPAAETHRDDRISREKTARSGLFCS